jgi:hypothetical protein
MRQNGNDNEHMGFYDCQYQTATAGSEGWTQGRRGQGKVQVLEIMLMLSTIRSIFVESVLVLEYLGVGVRNEQGREEGFSGEWIVWEGPRELCVGGGDILFKEEFGVDRVDLGRMEGYETTGRDEARRSSSPQQEGCRSERNILA